ncbi:MAG: Transcription factor S-II (TFIIS) [Bacteriophage sp.]|nr:MAG: Transcription factor S-II (TFIIS) [Bacteriophage sp.]
MCLTSDSRVIETTKLQDMVLRYRECKSCNHRFFTKEIDTTPEEVRILFNFRKKQQRAEKVNERKEQ